MAKVAVNGFGRVGRMFIRAATELDLNIVAINYYRPLDIQRMAYMLKYDSVQGRFRGDICYDDKHLIINDKKILIFSEKDVNKIPWSKASPQYLVECTGKFKTMEKAKPFLKEGIKKVIISAPSKDAPMFVMGVNSHQYNPKKHHIVSNASCTTNCLAPLAKVVHENFGICEGLMTTVHAVTPSQKVLDGFTKKKIRDGRCAILNIIPASTGAAKAVGKVIPELKGKLTGMAFRVPIADASVVDLTVGLERSASLDDLKCVIKDAARCSLKGILAYTEELIVSTDVIGTTYSSIFDASASMALNDKFVKLVSWYDNEYGYVCRLVDFVKMIHKMETCKS